MQIDQSTWHYRLFSVYTPKDSWDIRRGMTFCSYARWVTFGAVVAICIALMISLLLIGPMNWIISAVLYFVTDNGWMSYLVMPANGHAFDSWAAFSGSLAIGSTVLDFVLLVLFMMFVAGEMLDGWRVRRAQRRREANALPKEKPKEPGFFVTWYRSWKEKYCPIVTLKGE